MLAQQILAELVERARLNSGAIVESSVCLLNIVVEPSASRVAIVREGAGIPQPDI